MSVEQAAPAIEFADVSFRYASDGAAEGEGAGIAQVSLRVLPGECVVLTGPREAARPRSRAWRTAWLRHTGREP